jgi:hypothetical protein
MHVPEELPISIEQKITCLGIAGYQIIQTLPYRLPNDPDIVRFVEQTLQLRIEDPDFDAHVRPPALPLDVSARAR